MASNYWLKMYHEALYDPKLAALPDNLWRRFWECCLMAGEVNEGGFLPDVGHMAWTVRESVETITAELGQLAMQGFLELKRHKDGERWYVSNFAKRQEPSSAAKRMKEYRKRQREEKERTKEKEEIDTDNRYIANSNGSVTPVTKRNGKSNSQGGANPYWDFLPQSLSGSDDFIRCWHSWLTYANERNLDFTAEQARITLDEMSGWGVDRSVAALRESIKRGWRSVYEPKGGNSPANADDTDVWELALQHARRGDSSFSDPALKAAVRAFGWRKLQDIKAGDENFYRKEFMRIYHDQLEPAATA